MIGRQFVVFNGDEDDIAERLLRSVFPDECSCDTECREPEVIFSYSMTDKNSRREVRIELTSSGYGTISVDSLGGTTDDCMTFVTTPARSQMIANALSMMAESQRGIDEVAG